LLFLACYIEFAILKWDDFADFDNSYFTLYTLKGRSWNCPEVRGKLRLSEIILGDSGATRNRIRDQRR
jgi:hypothetical protein